MELGITGLRVLVTAGAGGIGLEIARAFWAEGARAGDRYNVCGFLALATLLEALPGVGGRVLDHLVWHEEPTRSAVSCAGMVFPGCGRA